MNFKNEVIEFINDNKLSDVFVNNNTFFINYNINMYIYLRVSTESQDFGRQLLELYSWAKNKNTTIYIKNIYCDKYTGKSLKRDGYMQLKENIKKNDYLVTTNLNRLGRNWDDIKKEWYSLEYNNINKIIIDNNNLSVQLPNETKEEMNLNRKMIQDITFSACLYSACQKIQEVSQSTKDGLKKAKMQGKILGKPKGKYSNTKNFIKMLKDIVIDNKSIKEALKDSKMPKMTFYKWLNESFIKYNINPDKEKYINLYNEIIKDDKFNV